MHMPSRKVGAPGATVMATVMAMEISVPLHMDTRLPQYGKSVP
jgi:hypothetical protein